jgi:hypothetical protein
MNRSLRSRLAFGSFLFLLSGGAAFAQHDDIRGPAALLGGMFMFFVVFSLALYVYVALSKPSPKKPTPKIPGSPGFPSLTSSS